MMFTNSVLFGQQDNGGGFIAMLVLLVELVLFAIIIAGYWVLFTKAGKPGWASIIPIYNMIVLLEIIGRPIWWIILLLIPCVNIVIAVILCIDLAKAFGKDAIYGIGMAFLPFIFVPMLAFGDARYRGPVVQG